MFKRAQRLTAARALKSFWDGQQGGGGAIPVLQPLSDRGRPASGCAVAVVRRGIRVGIPGPVVAQPAPRCGAVPRAVGLDWLKDSVVCQLAPLGADLYNGAPGVCVFLAAHAKVTGDDSAAGLPWPASQHCATICVA
jgi:hypothetical protein